LVAIGTQEVPPIAYSFLFFTAQSCEMNKHSSPTAR
jgi:hypothetical protein